MNNKKFRTIGALVLVIVWVALTGFVWFTPAKDVSEAERRPLEQKPEFSWEAFKDGTYTDSFGEFVKDQFPLRDSFRQLKGLVHRYLLNQLSDSNGMFYMDGHLSQHNMVYNAESVQKRMQVLNQIYKNFIKNKNANVYVSVIPDKNYYLAQNNSFPTVDYDKIFAEVQSQTAWGQYIDMTGILSLDNFYATDTHWKQETLIPLAQMMSQAMGVAGPKAEDFTAEKIDHPFYGVWYGKAGLPVAPDELYVLRSQLLDSLKVNVERSYQSDIYDLRQLTSSDPYNIYLSGAKKGYVTIENPNATTDKKLVIFRDSFGSSLAPLFVQDYQSVTLIDLRVFSRMGLMRVDFQDADVLFMLSALVLNNTSEQFK